MAGDFEVASFYTDLDTILDTRLATLLVEFGPEAADKAIAGGYFSRTYDEFEGIDTEAFKVAYAKRSKETLKYASVTPAMELVKIFAQQTLIALTSSPFRRQPKVVVNTYPYLLDDSEAAVLIAGIRASTDDLCDVEFIHRPTREVTPSYVRETFVQMAVYDYVGWLETHSTTKELADVQCPLVTMWAPALMASAEAAAKLEGINAFAAIETLAQLFIKLQLLPAKVFSMDMDKLLGKKKQGSGT